MLQMGRYGDGGHGDNETFRNAELDQGSKLKVES
jgi:hypothetical protein